MSNYFNYFTEIEETFVRRRGKNLLLSPLDWALMESWRERDIPLHIVLRAIEQVFDLHDAQPARRRSVKSLSYCKEEVEAQFAEWSDLQAGRGDVSADAEGSQQGFSREVLAGHIKSCLDALEELIPQKEGLLRDALERAHARMAALSDLQEGAERIEASLGAIDDIVDEAIIQQAEPLEREAVERQMAAYRDGMDPEAYERTLRLLLLKRLRESSAVPRFSLFHL